MHSNSIETQKLYCIISYIIREEKNLKLSFDGGYDGLNIANVRKQDYEVLLPFRNTNSVLGRHRIKSFTWQQDGTKTANMEQEKVVSQYDQSVIYEGRQTDTTAKVLTACLLK